MFVFQLKLIYSTLALFLAHWIWRRKTRFFSSDKKKLFETSYFGFGKLFVDSTSDLKFNKNSWGLCVLSCCDGGRRSTRLDKVQQMLPCSKQKRSGNCNRLSPSASINWFDIIRPLKNIWQLTNWTVWTRTARISAAYNIY